MQLWFNSHSNVRYSVFNSVVGQLKVLNHSFNLMFSGDISSMSPRHFLTNLPSLYGCYVTVSGCYIIFLKNGICFSVWFFKVTNLCLLSSVPFGSSRLMFKWSELKCRWKFEALKCTKDAWHKRQSGLPLRSTKKYERSHSVKNVLCSSSYFCFAINFLPAIFRANLMQNVFSNVCDRTGKLRTICEICENTVLNSNEARTHIKKN